jgi:serine/threonine-protein phosphatase 2A activator
MNCVATEKENCSHDTHGHSEKVAGKLPARSILTLADLEKFQTSPTHSKFMNFLTTLNNSIKNKPLTTIYDTSPAVLILIDILKVINNLIEEIPPLEVGLSRFGNPSFRTWLDKVQEIISDLIKPLNLSKPDQDEVVVYLMNSFGDRNRIDYGTGHEANFICFLYCLYQLGVLNENENEAVVFGVFWEYIILMRKLQSVYWLEPAGSHGVWGLDDYQFLPFLFGAAQLASIYH